MPRPRMSPDDVTLAKQTIATLLKDGIYLQEIARQTGYPETSVRRWAEQLGLPIPKCRSGPLQGPEHSEWGGGRKLDKHGYVYLWMPLHPAANNAGCVFEHRVSMEVQLRRYLTAEEVVDHRDDVPYHNWPSNLTLYPSNAEHLRATLSGRVKSSPRYLIPGAYGCTQTLPRCPDAPETLALTSSEIRDRISYFVESHRPTNEHRMIPRRKLRESGAHRDPWLPLSTVSNTDFLQTERVPDGPHPSGRTPSASDRSRGPPEY